MYIYNISIQNIAFISLVVFSVFRGMSVLLYCFGWGDFGLAYASIKKNE